MQPGDGPKYLGGGRFPGLYLIRRRISSSPPEEGGRRKDEVTSAIGRLRRNWLARNSLRGAEILFIVEPATHTALPPPDRPPPSRGIPPPNNETGGASPVCYCFGFLLVGSGRWAAGGVRRFRSGRLISRGGRRRRRGGFPPVPPRWALPRGAATCPAAGFPGNQKTAGFPAAGCPGGLLRQMENDDFPRVWLSRRIAQRRVSPPMCPILNVEPKTKPP